MSRPRHDWAGHTGASTAERYRVFADAGTAKLSPTYARLALGVVDDPEVLARLDELPVEKRQPNLLFAATRFLGGPLEAYAIFREWVLARWDEVGPIVASRRTQTNEPGRTATLVPALAGIEGPIALLEVGASAGLCLFPDRYAYTYRAATGEHRLGDSTVELPCRLDGAIDAPARLPDVVWRAGLDLNPLDVTDEADVRWLECLIWPEETERFARLRAAVAIARAESSPPEAPPRAGGPPLRIVRGDLLTDTAALAAQAPGEATLVLFHTAVLAYLDVAGRHAWAEVVRAIAAQRPVVWLAQEAPGVITAVPDSWALRGVDGPFVLSRDGAPLALVESRGRCGHWYA